MIKIKKYLLRSTILLLMLLSLFSCGKKGALYLPEEEQKEEKQHN